MGRHEGGRQLVEMGTGRYGDMGHTAALFDPDKYMEMLEETLG